MDIRYYMKIQNAHKANTKREKDLAKINRYADKHFDDTFDTDTVLVNGKQMQMMIIKDTDGNTFKKKIKTRHSDKINLGDYVIWNGQHWLITLLDYDDKTWNRGYMYLCPILLRWQNSNGRIIERWAYSEDFTKYATGETGNEQFRLGEYQFGFTLPVDDETKVLKRGRRFPIDLEGIEPPDVYELTNRKILLNDASSFGRGGTLVWTLSFSEFNAEKDKKITLHNGDEVWICDYNKPKKCKPNSSTSEIKFSGSPELRIGGSYKRLTGIIKDLNDNVVDVIGKWDIITIDEIIPFLDYSISNNELLIRIKENTLPLSGKIRIMFTNKDDNTSTYTDFIIVNNY